MNHVLFCKIEAKAFSNSMKQIYISLFFLFFSYTYSFSLFCEILFHEVSLVHALLVCLSQKFLYKPQNRCMLTFSFPIGVFHVSYDRVVAYVLSQHIGHC